MIKTEIQDLSYLEFNQAVLSLIFVIISIIMGIKLILKYEAGRKVMITSGLALIFLSSGWWGICSLFLWILFFNSILPPVIPQTLDVVLIPWAVVSWIYTYLHLNFPKYENEFTIFAMIAVSLYEIFYFWLLFQNYLLVGTPIEGSILNFKHTLHVQIFLLSVLIIAIITGFHFAYKASREEKKSVSLKGKFLLIAFILLSAGILFDILSAKLLFLFIGRIILMVSAIMYYLGFFLPERIGRLFIKDYRK